MSAIDDIEFKIARLDLRPGDILVLKLRDQVPTWEMDRFRKIMQEITGDHKCLVLENGVDLAILTAAEIEARSTAPTSDEAAV